MVGFESVQGKKSLSIYVGFTEESQKNLAPLKDCMQCNLWVMLLLGDSGEREIIFSSDSQKGSLAPESLDFLL